MSAKIYDDLPFETRKEPSFSLFSDKLNTLFKHEHVPSYDLHFTIFRLLAASSIMPILIFFTLDSFRGTGPSVKTAY